MRNKRKRSHSLSDNEDIPLNKLKRTCIENRKKSYSWSSDDSAMPLKELKIHLNGNINKLDNELYKYSIHVCDICDKTFANRYNFMIHSAKHIIIPLLKLKPEQCPECLFCFTSHPELTSHITENHPHLTETPKIPQLAQNIIKEETITNLKQEEDIYETIKYDNDDYKKPNMAAVKNCGNIRNRIVFEDDFDDDLLNFDPNGLLKDLTTDCKVNVEIFDQPWIFGGPKNNIHISESLHIKDESNVEYCSIHYDNLIKPGVFRCKHCSKTFPNKFETYKHEIVHLKMKRSYLLLCYVCETFIPGNFRNLEKHIQMKHGNPPPRRHMLGRCQKCGLRYYSLNKHKKNYHYFFTCQICGKGFEEESERDDHRQIHNAERKCDNCDHVSTDAEMIEHKKICRRYKTKIIKVCDVCQRFFKNTIHKYYYNLGEVSEVGVIQTCQRCQCKSFTLNKIERVHIGPIKKQEYNKRPKTLSNAERLKNIQQRLKYINNLSKY